MFCSYAYCASIWYVYVFFMGQKKSNRFHTYWDLMHVVNVKKTHVKTGRNIWVGDLFVVYWGLFACINFGYGSHSCTVWKLGSKVMTPWLWEQRHLLKAPGYLWRFFCVRGSWFTIDAWIVIYRVYLFMSALASNYPIWFVEYVMRSRLCQLDISHPEFSLHDVKIGFWMPAFYFCCVTLNRDMFWNSLVNSEKSRLG